MIELLADALQRPRFEPDELEGVRERRIEFIRAAKDSEPQSLIASYGRARLFGAHPFGQPVSGSERSLPAITADDLAHYHADHIGADRLTLVFAGDFDARVLRAAVTRAFGGWRAAAVPLPALPAPARVAGRRVLLVDAPGAAQTYFWIGNTGVARHYPQRAALEMTNTAFGGSFGSMLMQALRVQHGLTYSAGSSFRRGSVPGEFAISSFTETASTARALEITLETLDRLKQHGAEAHALASARSYIQGQYPLNFETAADWAAALADLELHGLPSGYIDDFDAALDRVDAAQSRQVILEAFPDSRDVDIVLIGDAARIRSEASSVRAAQRSSAGRAGVQLGDLRPHRRDSASRPLRRCSAARAPHYGTESARSARSCRDARGPPSTHHRTWTSVQPAPRRGSRRNAATDSSCTSSASACCSGM